MMEYTLFGAFIAGLLGGTHCIGMCGPIVGALTFNLQPDDKSRLPFLLAYNAGRISSYTLAGVLVGGISAMASNLDRLHIAQTILQVLAALFMIALGLYLANWWRGLVKVEQAGGAIWRHIEPLSRRFIPVTSVSNAFLAGILWGWLPCGLVYTILFWCITSGSAIQGGLIMLSFGLGTLPMLLSMGLFATGLRELVSKNWIRQLAGAMIILFGLYMLLGVLRQVIPF